MFSALIHPEMAKRLSEVVDSNNCDNMFALYNVLRQGISTGTTYDSQTLSLASEIPREQIETKVEAILAKNLTRDMKALKTNMIGYHRKKHGFREVIHSAALQAQIPQKGSTSKKRKRSGAKPRLPGTSRQQTSNTTEMGANDWKKTCIDHNWSVDLAASSFVSTSLAAQTTSHQPVASTSKANVNSVKIEVELDDSASSNDGRLVIDCKEQPEKAEIQKHEAAAKDALPIAPEKAKLEYSSFERFRINSLKKRNKKRVKPSANLPDIEYRPSMAREFPGANLRTDAEQARRTSNTEAARISRLKNKAYEEFLENESKMATKENIGLKRRNARLRVYINTLLELRGEAPLDLSKMFDENIEKLLSNDKWVAFRR